MFIFVYFFTQTDPTRTVQRSALRRSRRELSNAYLLAKIGVDTAENEPLEVWGQNSMQYSLHSLDMGLASPLDRANFTGLVIGCIEATFLPIAKICNWSLASSSWGASRRCRSPPPRAPHDLAVSSTLPFASICKEKKDVGFSPSRRRTSNVRQDSAKWRHILSDFY